MIRERLGAVLFLVLASISGRAQSPPTTPNNASIPALGKALETTETWNRRLEELVHGASARQTSLPSSEDYRIGPEDLVTITVFEATELNLSVRVSASGEISLPLLGSIQAGGRTPRELELILQELLRHSYVKDPHVNVLVSDMQSHPVSVMGAVKKPGVYQIRGAKTLLEILSMAEGLAEDAGEMVLVMHGNGAGAISSEKPESGKQTTRSSTAEKEAGQVTTVSLPPEEPKVPGTVEVSLRSLLERGDPACNILVYPGDIVKVQRAGIVYIVGEVNKPGGFPMPSNQKVTVTQAVALGQGLTRTAKQGSALVIRTTEDGRRIEIPVDLAKVLKGQTPDMPLEPRDIVYIPNSSSKTAGRGVFEALSRVFRLGSNVIWR